MVPHPVNIIEVAITAEVEVEVETEVIIGGRGRGEFSSRYMSTDHQKQESSTMTETQQEPNMAEPLLCHYCKEPNHFERYRLRRKRDHKMQSTNYYHNKLLPLEIKESISSGDEQGSKHHSEASSEEHAVIPEGERHKLIGDRPEVEAVFGKVQLRCLLDSGSQFTTITESFYNPNFKDNALMDSD